LGREKIREAVDADADVIILSYHLSRGRLERAGRAQNPEIPALTTGGWRRAVSVLHELAGEARDAGRLAVYHPHVGTYIETPMEIDHLLEATDPTRLKLCLDVGHYTLGGGDPIEALRRYGSRTRHIHFKDVASEVLAQVRADARIDFFGALRKRIFTELGFGVLDVAGIVDQLFDLKYSGWIMCEQDTSWWPAAESAAISRRVLDFALRAGARRRERSS
jgi:inosose dehydratase